MPQSQRYDQEKIEVSDDELSHDHLDSQVQRAQEQLLSLKRQQDTIERQKRELEELSRRQDLFQQGATDMVEKFTRAIVVLEREGYDAQKRVELLHSIHECFTAHLQNLESINTKDWEGQDMMRELTKALSAVDDARAEYTKALPRISVAAASEEGDAAGAIAGYHLDEEEEPVEKDFMYWLKAGTAFTLPLTVVGCILLFLLISFFSR